MFKINHDEVMEFGLIDEGTYEVVVQNAFEDAANTGTMFINLQLIIRNDIDQKHKNQYIFASIWQSKQTGEYHSGMINSVAKALNIENGKTFNTLQELLDDFKRKTARVTVKHEEYNGNTNARVKFWEQTKFPQNNHKFKTNSNDVPEGFHPTSNDDIPF